MSPSSSVEGPLDKVSYPRYSRRGGLLTGSKELIKAALLFGLWGAQADPGAAGVVGKLRS